MQNAELRMQSYNAELRMQSYNAECQRSCCIAMIWITGDTHGDLSEFKKRDKKKLGKGDTLIICGDFGFVWDGSQKEQRALEWFAKRKYTVLFTEGCHEGYDLLEQYPIVEWSGGLVRRINDNLFQLMRGEIYDIDGKKVFAFGGGEVDEKEYLDALPDLYQKSQPSNQEIQNGIDNLAKIGNKVDLIVTHDVPTRLKGFINIEDNRYSAIHVALEEFNKFCDFKLWYFGKYHSDKFIPPYYHGVFTKVNMVV
ncbi:MAG: metallophosphoesterase [Oscillospiraceae bacterium]|nr:metallophosphoesterase [Oscillospiraceae bacterium]